MATEVKLPQLAQTMEEATIVSCRVKVGDEVKKDDVIFEIETDKATLEMESPADGFVKHILAEVGQTLSIGGVIMVLGGKDEKVPQSFVNSLKGGTPAAAAGEAAPAAPAAEPAKLVDAAEVKLGATITVNRLQKLTAEKMLKSKREIPCFYLNVKADVTDLVELRDKMNRTSPAKGRIKISYNDFIMRAVALGLEKFPIMTGRLVGDTIKLAEAIHIGLAISVPDGLVAPVVKDVHKKDVIQIACDSKALIEKARSNKLSPTDLQGGCITVSNLGALGIESFIAIVVPGQCSILGIGQITDTCVPGDGKGSHPCSFGFALHRMPDGKDKFRGDEFTPAKAGAKDRKMGPNIAVRKLMNMTLSVDHKVANGAYAAQFLDYIKKLLEDTCTFA